MGTILFFHPSVDIDPVPTGVGGVVRGATVTITGKAACIKETIKTPPDPESETSESSPESIREVAVRLGQSGTFVKATPTGPVSSTTQQKTWSTWTTDPRTITGVVNDALEITVRVSAGVVAQPSLAHDTMIVTVDRTPPVLSLNTPDEMTQAVDNGKTTFQLAGAARDDRSPVVAVEWVLGQGQQFTPATPRAPGDWSAWTAGVPVSPAGTYQLLVRARDGEGNTTPPRQVTLHAIDPFQPQDPGDVFGQASYLDDLLDAEWLRAADAASPDIELLQEREIQEARRALSRIKEPMRSCLLLKHEGLSYREIASALEINEANIGSLIARGRREFIRFYGKIGGNRP